MSENASDLDPLTAQSLEQPLTMLDREPTQLAPSTKPPDFEQPLTESKLESPPPTIKLSDFDSYSLTAQSFEQSPIEPGPKFTPTTHPESTLIELDLESMPKLDLESMQASSPADSLKWINGRGFYEDGNPVYPLPGDEYEENRQNVQHYLLRFVFQANYTAPVRDFLERGGARVLDAGCGTGIWSVEMARDYPNSEFIGTDIAPSFTKLQEMAPQNCHFQFANTMDLPFPDDTFDYVFQRLAWTCYRDYEWPKVISELLRVVKPGGWLEFVDSPLNVNNSGPLTNEFLSKVKKVLELRDIKKDTILTLASALKSAGLENVIQGYNPVPIAWGPNEIAMSSKKNVAAAWSSLRTHILLALGLKDEEFNEIYNGALSEFAPYKSYWKAVYVYGRKPIKEGDYA